jgi:hypothetical protein
MLDLMQKPRRAAGGGEEAEDHRQDEQASHG